MSRREGVSASFFVSVDGVRMVRVFDKRTNALKIMKEDIFTKKMKKKGGKP